MISTGSMKMSAFDKCIVKVSFLGQASQMHRSRTPINLDPPPHPIPGCSGCGGHEGTDRACPEPMAKANVDDQSNVIGPWDSSIGQEDKVTTGIWPMVSHDQCTGAFPTCFAAAASNLILWWGSVTSSKFRGQSFNKLFFCNFAN